MRVLLVGMMALALAPVAQAENQPHPTLDQIASEVAGYPATVWCENSDAEWAALGGRQNSGGFVRWWSGAALPEPVAYIAPSVCLPLTEALSDWRGVAPREFAIGLHSLLHEAVHLSGERDEGATDCRALDLLPDYAVAYFGVPEQVATKRRVVHWRWVKRAVWVRHDGERVKVVKRVRVRVRHVVTVYVRNPELDGLYSYAYAEHLFRSWADPQYQGDC